MRERLTLAFVLLAVAVLIGAGVVRSFTLQDLMEQQETMHLEQEARLTLVLVDDQRRSGKPVDKAFLSRIASPTSRIEFIPSGGTPVVNPPQGGGLPFTGDALALLARTALALLGAGLVLLVLSRRRRQAA